MRLSDFLSIPAWAVRNLPIAIVLTLCVGRTILAAPANAKEMPPIQALISPRHLSDDTKQQLLATIEKRFGNRLQQETRAVTSKSDRNLHAVVRETLGYALEYDGSLEARKRFQSHPKTNERIVEMLREVNGLGIDREKPWMVPERVSTVIVPVLPKHPGIKATDNKWQVFDLRADTVTNAAPKLFSLDDCAPTANGGSLTSACAKTGSDLRDGGRWFFTLAPSDWDDLLRGLSVAARAEVLGATAVSDSLDADVELVALADSRAFADPCVLPGLEQEAQQWEEAFAAPLRPEQRSRILSAIKAITTSPGPRPQLMALDWFNRDFKNLELSSLVQCISKKDWPDELYFHGQNVLRVISGYLQKLGGDELVNAAWQFITIEPISPAMTTAKQRQRACDLMNAFASYMARQPEQQQLWQAVQSLNCKRFLDVNESDPQGLKRTPMMYVRSVLHHYLIEEPGPVVVTTSFRTGGQYDMIPSQPLKPNKAVVSAVQDEGVIVEQAGDEPQTSIFGRLSSGAFLLVSTADEKNPNRRFGCSDSTDSSRTPAVSFLAPGSGFADGLCRYSFAYTSFATPAIATQLLLAQLYFQGIGRPIDTLTVRKRLHFASHPVPEWVGKFAAPGIPLLSRLLDMSDELHEAYLLICRRDLRQRCERYDSQNFTVQVVLADAAETRITLGSRWGSARYAGFSFAGNRLLYIQDLGPATSTSWRLEERELKEVIFRDSAKNETRTLRPQDLKQEAITEAIWP